MAQYVKMTNGPVKLLVDIRDTATINDKLEDGFRAEWDNEGEVVLVDSSELMRSDNTRVNEVLDMIKLKQSKNKNNK